MRMSSIGLAAAALLFLSSSGAGQGLHFAAGAGLYSPSIGVPGEQRRIGWHVDGLLRFPLNSVWTASMVYTWAKADEVAVSGQHPDQVSTGLREDRLQLALGRQISGRLWAQLATGVSARELITTRPDCVLELHSSECDREDGPSRAHFILEPSVALRFPSVDVRVANAFIAGPYGGGLNPSVALVIPIS